MICFRAGESEAELDVFGSLEPEPEPLEKIQEPEPLGKKVRCHPGFFSSSSGLKLRPRLPSSDLDDKKKSHERLEKK